MPKVASPPLPDGATAGQIARAAGVTERVILGRKADGRLPVRDDGSIDLSAIIKAGIAALAVEAKGDGDGDTLALTAERARLAKAQADQIEMKNAVTRGDLIPRPDVVLGMQTAFAHCRAKLLAIPAKAAPELVNISSPATVRDRLRDVMHDALAELAATRARPEDSEPAPRHAVN